MFEWKDLSRKWRNIFGSQMKHPDRLFRARWSRLVLHRYKCIHGLTSDHYSCKVSGSGLHYLCGVLHDFEIGVFIPARIARCKSRLFLRCCATGSDCGLSSWHIFVVFSQGETSDGPLLCRDRLRRPGNYDHLNGISR